MNAPTPEFAAQIVKGQADHLWYKDAIIYQLHVKSFFDSNNDGIGDFPGLISKLDYIADLGVNTLWLLPFYPSPRLDDGYDISDYRSVHPEYGRMADVKRFIAAAHKRGLRVITELVINHTSDQHPWFQRARRAKPGSPARDFYVWSDTDQKYQDTRIIFIDSERSNWTWDPVANAYYWHRFYSHQPDLNFDNPKVLEAVLGVMRFWLDLGVDGLRLDAVPYLVEREGTNNENLAETHVILKKIRAELDRTYPDRNGGFSKADFNALALPAIMDPLYGYETVNVEAASRDPHSLLHWMRRMLAVRRTHAAFGRGTLRFIYPKNRKVLAYLREHEGEAILCVANVSRTPQAVELDLSEFAGRVPIELNGGSLFPPVGRLTYLLTLPPFGFYWFILAKESDAPSWHTPAPEPMPDFVTLVLRDKLADGLKLSAEPLLNRDTLPAYLTKRRWFSAKEKTLGTAKLAYTARLPGGDRELLLAEVETQSAGETARWLLPLSIVWEDESSAALPNQLALARVRRGRRVGLLTDAFALQSFAQQMTTLLADGAAIETPEGKIEFRPMPDTEESLRRKPDSPVLWLTAEQSNSSLIVDDAVMLKIFRKVAAGHHPEAEMGRYLTAHGFMNSPLLLGEVVRVDPEGQEHSLAVAQSFIRNQGDA